MAQDVTVDVATNLITFLTDTDNLPVTDLTDTDVTCQYLKEGDTSFTVKTLNGSNFTEIGSGIYKILFTSGELDTIGSFTWIVNGASIQQFFGLANVKAADVATTPITAQTCNITGHVLGPSGKALKDATVYARVISAPSIQDNFGISDTYVSTKTNDYGQFFLELIREIDVEIFIPDINYRRQLTVPNTASVNLFTGIL